MSIQKTSFMGGHWPGLWNPMALLLAGKPALESFLHIKVYNLYLISIKMLDKEINICNII